MTHTTHTCPCGSALALSACCAVFHAGKAAPTAEALMRSRYTAYLLGLHDYIHQTWHPDSRPSLEELGGTGLQWFHLEIVACKQGKPTDDAGEVHFIACYMSSNKGGLVKGKALEENSRFIRQDGQWFYVDGDCQAQDIARNQACPCGSKLKFKRCCLHHPKQPQRQKVESMPNLASF